MSTPSDCCKPCATVPTVNVPGIPGATGDQGSDGVNAYTITTASFTVPLVGGSVTVLVANSSWMTIGQTVFIPGAGTFEVTAIPGTGSITIEYLGYSGNTNTGLTVAVGAAVVPTGTEPAVTLLPPVTSYAVNGSQVLLVAPAPLLSLSATLAAGTYLLLATARVDLYGTTVAPTLLTLYLKCTTNTVAAIANAQVDSLLGINTTPNKTVFAGSLPAVVYEASAGDVVELYGSVAGLPYTGSIEAIEGSIFAIKLA